MYAYNERRFVMQEWKQKQFVGVSVKNWDEMLRAIYLGANMVEIKLEKFAENGKPLYTQRKGHFRKNHKVLGELAAIAEERSVAFQLHLPIERCVNPMKETGINVGVRSHHEVALRRFILLEEINLQYPCIGSIITIHPPTLSFNYNSVLPADEILENTKIFYEMLDEYRLKHDHQTLIGLENQPGAKLLATCLGDSPKHFKYILKNTRTIGVTIDSGHRLLAENFTVTELLGFAFTVVNFHFHGNDGIFDFETYDDDQHQIPMYDNVKGYKNYLRFLRRHRTPVVLELSNLGQYKDDELKNVIENLKREAE